MGVVGVSRFGLANSGSYHGVAENPYPLPNDDAEKTRLDKLQYCVRARLGANVIAPISPSPTYIGTPA